MSGFVGLDGKLHAEGDFYGLDGQYHPATEHLGVHGKYVPISSPYKIEGPSSLEDSHYGSPGSMLGVDGQHSLKNARRITCVGHFILAQSSRKV